MTATNPYRGLPAVDELAAEVDGRLPRLLTVEAARTALELARRRIGEGEEVDVRAEAARLVAALERSATTRVINASGVLLHTNLGRAPWSAGALEGASMAASGYTNLEVDLETGARGRRGGYTSALLEALTGAEDAMVVNNNAAAVLLCLAATAGGRAVPVARGELIEIGGAYRLPEVMEAGGTRLVEVGTTNRTRTGDYRTALQVHRCGAILKVHPSNYRIEGFTSEAPVEELAALAGEHGVPLIHDIGSGLLDSSAGWYGVPLPEWLRGEPAARQSIEAGADLVTFSGDKLLGGPQAGVVVGTASAMELIRSSPLTRALRVDGVTDAALAATLEAYAEGDITRLPFWRLALTPAEELASRASVLADRLGGVVVEGHSTVGAGSVPGMTLPSPHVGLPGEDHLYESLLAADTPVLALREEGDLRLDLRTVEPESDELVAAAVLRCRS